MRPCDYRGRIYVKWFIEKDGCISEIEFLRASHPLLEEELVRITQLMPRWTPAKFNGETRASIYTFPFCIKFE